MYTLMYVQVQTRFSTVLQHILVQYLFPVYAPDQAPEPVASLTRFINSWEWALPHVYMKRISSIQLMPPFAIE
jgi:hypothetical protein